MPGTLRRLPCSVAFSALSPPLPICLLTLALAGGAGAQTAFSLRGGPTLDVLQKAHPFQNNNGQIPPAGEYSGPLFSLNHNWPTAPDPLKDAPWQKAIGNGPIDRQCRGLCRRPEAGGEQERPRPHHAL